MIPISSEVWLIAGATFISSLGCICLVLMVVLFFVRRRRNVATEGYRSQIDHSLSELSHRDTMWDDGIQDDEDHVILLNEED